MSVTGRSSLSFRKKDIQEQKDLAIGFKKTMFAHKATAGDTGIDLDALVGPSEMTGFVNPSVNELLDARLLFYRKNLTLVSSLRGVLMDYLSYNVATSSRINFVGFTAAADEIFTGIVDYNPRNGLQVVDAVGTVASGTLAVGVYDFNAGNAFEINKYASQQVGAVVVYRNGIQQFRNTDNSSVTLDGNYYEVNNGSGLGNVIRFNVAPVGVDDNILALSNGLVAYAPDGSALQTIESLAGQIDAMIPTLADLAGVPETDFQAAPNNQDLKTFGDWVLGLLNADVPIVTDWVSYTPGTNVTTNTTVTGKWRRVGDSVECSVHYAWSGAPTAFTFIDVDVPSGLTIDTSKMPTTGVGELAVGDGNLFDPAGGTTRYGTKAFYIDSNSVRVQYLIQVTGASTIVHWVNITNAAPFAIGASSFMNVTFKVPIVDWAANQTLRDQLGI